MLVRSGQPPSPKVADFQQRPVGTLAARPAVAAQHEVLQL